MNQEEKKGQFRVCQIWGAGQYYGQEQVCPDASLLIAADGGADQAASRGVTPDLIVGDFDSITSPPLPDAGPGDQGRSRVSFSNQPGHHSPIVKRLPAEKDDTDMLAAVKLGWEQGCRIFQIYGGLGGRMDHTLANLNLISRVAAAGGWACMHGQGMVVTAISCGSLSFPAWPCEGEAILSVLSASDKSAGIREEGLKYQVENMTMTNLEVTGVSNAFLPNTPAKILVEEGIIHITYPEQAPKPTWQTRITPLPSLGPVETKPSQWLA